MLEWGGGSLVGQIVVVVNPAEDQALGVAGVVRGYPNYGEFEEAGDQVPSFLRVLWGAPGERGACGVGLRPSPRYLAGFGVGKVGRQDGNLLL